MATLTWKVWHGMTWFAENKTPFESLLALVLLSGAKHHACIALHGGTRLLPFPSAVSPFRLTLAILMSMHGGTAWPPTPWPMLTDPLLGSPAPSWDR